MRNPDSEIWVPGEHEQFDEEFKLLEKKHPQVSYILLIFFTHLQKRTGIKVGVIYARPGQTEPKDMFQNGINGDKCSDAFWTFLNGMGSEIDIESMNPPSSWTSISFDQLGKATRVMSKKARRITISGRTKLMVVSSLDDAILIRSNLSCLPNDEF